MHACSRGGCGRLSGLRRLRSLDAAALSLVGAVLAYSTTQMMIVPALPAIQRDLGAEPDAIAWIVSVFLTSTAVASPLAGRCGDLFGKRRVLVVVLAIFSLGGVLGLVASSVEALIVARVLQGVGGAVFPLAYGLVRDIVRPDRVPVAVGVIAGSFGLGGPSGWCSAVCSSTRSHGRRRSAWARRWASERRRAHCASSPPRRAACGCRWTLSEPGCWSPGWCSCCWASRGMCRSPVAARR